jgi:hypothetical protein
MLTGDQMRRCAMVAAAAALVVASEGCSSSGSLAPAESSSTSIVIDGRSRTIEGKVVCVQGPTGEMSIEVDPLDTAEGMPPALPIVVLDLTPRGDAPSVSLLSIHLPDIGLSAGRYRQKGTPKATKAGNTYTVKGEASVVGTPPETRIYKPFELELTCP